MRLKVSGQIIIDKLAIIYSGSGKYENAEDSLPDEQRAKSVNIGVLKVALSWLNPKTNTFM